MDWELGVDVHKLLHLKWINYRSYCMGTVSNLRISHNGKEYLKNNVCICVQLGHFAARQTGTMLYGNYTSVFSSVQSLSCVQLFATPWPADLRNSHHSVSWGQRDTWLGEVAGRGWYTNLAFNLFIEMFKHIIFVNTSERHWLIHLPRGGWSGGLSPTILFPIWISELFLLKKKDKKTNSLHKKLLTGGGRGEPVFLFIAET